MRYTRIIAMLCRFFAFSLSLTLFIGHLSMISLLGVMFFDALFELTHLKKKKKRMFFPVDVGLFNARVRTYLLNVIERTPNTNVKM